MMSYGHLWHVLTLWSRHFSMTGDTPAMPLTEAHFGGFFVSSSWFVESSRRKTVANSREGMTR